MLRHQRGSQNSSQSIALPCSLRKVISIGIADEVDGETWKRFIGGVHLCWFCDGRRMAWCGTREDSFRDLNGFPEGDKKYKCFECHMTLTNYCNGLRVALQLFFLLRSIVLTNKACSPQVHDLE